MGPVVMALLASRPTIGAHQNNPPAESREVRRDIHRRYQ